MTYRPGIPMPRLLTAALLAACASGLPALAQSPMQSMSPSVMPAQPAAHAPRLEATKGRFGLAGDFATNFVGFQVQYSTNIITATLETALKRSRDTARASSRPIPDDIRKGLFPFYSDETMKDVRYSIGDVSPDGLAGFAIRNGNAAAVTLVDTIVFKDESYVKNLALWAHEMHHIEQYKAWGVNGFAARYAFNWQSVEDEASKAAADFVIWYKKSTGQIQ
jgi:hypothetical protein